MLKTWIIETEKEKVESKVQYINKRGEIGKIRKGRKEEKAWAYPRRSKNKPSVVHSNKIGSI